MMASQLQTIRLLGKPYKVRCPEGEVDALHAAAEMLSERLQDTQRQSGLTGREDIIMMTALNLCHEQQVRQKSKKDSEN